MKERAVAVTVLFDFEPSKAAPEDLSEELELLVSASGIECAKRVILKEKTANAAHLIGIGKLESVAAEARQLKANVIIFSHDVSATQQKNLEKIFGVKTIDRTQLILDIFAQRARSNEGKLQVELAQLKYLLPRLAGQGIYMSRLGGGIGTRGPGEQKLEVDRRRAREKVVRLSRQLEKLKNRRTAALTRKKENDLAVIALVGYTNAGKSSLFNALTQSAVTVKNQLFSTLDTTTRLIELPQNQKALLVDTVGFIRDLPHHLVESFKATLEEAVEADIILHVIDASRPDRALLEEAVNGVLDSLEADRSRMVRVLNKCDLVPEPASEDALAVSAKTGTGLVQLKKYLSDLLCASFERKSYLIPSDRGDLLPYLYRHAHILSRRDLSHGVALEVLISPKLAQIFESKLQ